LGLDDLKKEVKYGWDLRKESRGWTEVRGFLTGAQARFKIIDRTLYIYVLHTNELIDWVTNFKATSYTEKFNDNMEFTAHTGFSIAATELHSKIRDILAARGFFEFDKVFISGYSQGGSIAPLLALRLALTYQKMPFICIAMEGAKYIKQVNFKLANLKVYNIINGNDIVTKLPFWFHKYDECIYIGKKRHWWKTGLVFRYDKTEKGIRKFIDLPEHQWASFENSLNNWLEAR